jgi:transposase
MLARQGVTIDRSTLGNWVGRACWRLTPLYDPLVSTVLSSPKLFADDTTLPVLDPGRGRTKTGQLWCYAVDDRPWDGPAHPAAAYVYSEDRKGIRPATHLASFRGVLQVDGYGGFKRLAGDRTDALVQLAFCRVGGDVAAPTPHRPGRADFPHPVLHERDSLAAA